MRHLLSPRLDHMTPLRLSEFDLVQPMSSGDRASIIPASAALCKTGAPGAFRCERGVDWYILPAWGVRTAGPYPGVSNS